MIRLLTILGARPQFIKAAVVSRALTEQGNSVIETIVHTGQHFDYNMDKIFFNELNIPSPKYNLNINSLGHGAMTGLMLEKIEAIILDEKPNIVVVYGDTNSTLAGALAAKKLHIKIAHIEAGLRSFNTSMPEEVNRILTDRMSDILYCPTDKALENLRLEGYQNFGCRILKSGDVMFDLAKYYTPKIKTIDFPVSEVKNKEYVLCTIHREENTSRPERFSSIIAALNVIAEDTLVVLPAHPRIRSILPNVTINSNIKILEPLGYFGMMKLVDNCQLVLTDSGGLQKEAFFFKKNCVILREQTEWTELVEHGFNMISGIERDHIYNCYKEMKHRDNNFDIDLFGNGHAGEIIVDSLLQL